MSGAGITDLAVGLAFFLSITAGISCALTEMTARLLGIRGAYLLRGIYQLMDGDASTSTDLTQAQEDYVTLTTMLWNEPTGGSGTGRLTAASVRVSALPSATGALLGSPILRNQGMAGQISDRRLTLKPTSQDGRYQRCCEYRSSK
jgi:hypothetical protein